MAPIANEEDEDEDSKNMNKRVYIDDVIDKVAMFLRFQLQNTIYPSFDPVYKELSKVGFPN